MSENADRDLEELREGSSFGDRDDDSDPYREIQEQNKSEEESDDQETDPVEEVVDCLEEIRDGDQTPSIGGRDETIAAYLNYLKQNPERMRAVGDELTNHLEEETDVNAPNVDPEEKAGILKLLLRVGATEAIPEEYDIIGEANAEYARRNA